MNVHASGQMDDGTDTVSHKAPLITNAEPAVTESGDLAPNLGVRLRQARLHAKMSLREMARQLGVSPSFVSQLENGKSQPSVATLYSLSQLLGVSIDHLFDVQDPSSTAPLKPGRTKLAGDEAGDPGMVAAGATFSSAGPNWARRPRHGGSGPKIAPSCP